MVRSRVSRAFHFLTDRHRETQRMLLRKPLTWQAMLDMMHQFEITAPYPWQRKFVMEALHGGEFHTVAGMPVVVSPYMPRNTLFLVNPAHIVIVPPEPAPWAQCIVPW